MSDSNPSGNGYRTDEEDLRYAGCVHQEAGTGFSGNYCGPQRKCNDHRGRRKRFEGLPGITTADRIVGSRQ